MNQLRKSFILSLFFGFATSQLCAQTPVVNGELTPIAVPYLVSSESTSQGCEFYPVSFKLHSTNDGSSKILDQAVLVNHSLALKVIGSGIYLKVQDTLDPGLRIQEYIVLKPIRSILEATRPLDLQVPLRNLQQNLKPIEWSYFVDIQEGANVERIWLQQRDQNFTWQSDVYAMLARDNTPDGYVETLVFSSPLFSKQRQCEVSSFRRPL